MYQKSEDEIEEEAARTCRIAKHNLSRSILKPMDFYRVLPPDETGIMRNSYPISLMPYNPTSSLEKATRRSEMTFVTNTVTRLTPNFAIFTSRTWGMSQMIIPWDNTANGPTFYTTGSEGNKSNPNPQTLPSISKRNLIISQIYIIQANVNSLIKNRLFNPTVSLPVVNAITPTSNAELQQIDID